MNLAWIRPEFIEVSVNSECTAYSDVLIEELI